MQRDTFIEELRRREENSFLFLARSKRWAKQFGVHAWCYLLWDRSPRTGIPYVVMAIADQRGMPRDPEDCDFDTIARMRLAVVSGGGRQAWADEQARAQIHAQDKEQERKDTAHEDWFRHHALPEMLHRSGARLIIPAR